MTDKIVVPEGWKMDGEGRLVQVSKINPQVLEEDEMTVLFMQQAMSIQAQMQQMKAALISNAEAFMKRLVQDYGVKRLEKIKGNLDFYSFDKKYRMSRRVQDTIRVNSRIEAARQLFDQYINAVTKDLEDDGVRTLINRAFKPAKKNEFSVSKLVSLLNLEITHPLFKQAVSALREALETDTSCVYYNFYERNEQGAYEILSLRFSDVAPAKPAEATEQQGAA